MVDSGDGKRITLSDGSSIWEDDTIARGAISVDQLLAVRDLLIESESPRLELSRDGLNSSITCDISIETEAAISFFTGLRQAGVATESKAGQTYADYTFEVDREAAVDLIDQQLIAKLALDRVAEEAPEETGVRLVVGLPRHIRPDSFDNPAVTRLGPRIRSMLFDADEIVRIANPYFDRSDAVISDLASLPRRGIDTRIITRQYDTNRTTRRALERVVESIGDEGLANLEVRDFYAEDEMSGDHAYAVHAKTIVTDDRRCYIGSANLMQTGLSANFELGVLLEGPMVESIIEIFDKVFEAAEPVELAF